MAAARGPPDRGLRCAGWSRSSPPSPSAPPSPRSRSLPFVEYLFLSRGYTWRQFTGLNPLAAPASTLITALVPRFLGEHCADTYAGPLNYLEQTMYAGIPVLMLAVVGAIAGWRRRGATGARSSSPPRRLATLAVYGAPGVLHVISMLPLVKGATLTRIPIVAITSAHRRRGLRRRGARGRASTPTVARDARRAGAALAIAAAIAVAVA